MISPLVVKLFKMMDEPHDFSLHGDGLHHSATRMSFYPHYIGSKWWRPRYTASVHFCVDHQWKKFKIIGQAGHDFAMQIIAVRSLLNDDELQRGEIKLLREKLKCTTLQSPSASASTASVAG